MKVLLLTNRLAGLFSLLNGALGALDEISTPGGRFYGMVPYYYLIGIPTYRTYWTESGWRGKKNAWEYYFSQLSDLDIDSTLKMSYEELLKKRPNLILDPQTNIEKPWPLNRDVLVTNNYYGPPQSATYCFGTPENQSEIRRRLAALFKKHIKVHPELVAIADEFHLKNFDKHRVVGIHFRGTDKASETVPHLKSRGLDGRIKNVFEYIEVAEASKPDKIFLATDCSVALKMAQERLGNRLVVANATRSAQQSPIFIQDNGSGPRIGDEAVVDFLLLSKCDHVVHGFSNLVQSVLYYNEHLTGTYMYA